MQYPVNDDAHDTPDGDGGEPAPGTRSAWWLRRHARDFPELSSVDEVAIVAFKDAVTSAALERSELRRAERTLLKVTNGLSVALALVLLSVTLWKVYESLYGVGLSWRTISSAVLIYCVIWLCLGFITSLAAQNAMVAGMNIPIFVVLGVGLWLTAPAGLEGIGIGLLIGVVSYFLSFFMVGAVTSLLWQRIRARKCHPYSLVISLLADVVVCWKLYGWPSDDRELRLLAEDNVVAVAPSNRSGRAYLAGLLEAAARTAEGTLGKMAPPGMRVRQNLIGQGQEIANFLRKRQAEIFVSDAGNWNHTMGGLLVDLWNGAFKDWEKLTSSERAGRPLLARIVRRVALSSLFVLIGIFAPKLLPDVLGEISREFTVTFLSAALLALVSTPGAAVEKMVDVAPKL